MNSTEILDLYRLAVGDTEVPHLWSDTEAYGFLDDAQNEFCRRTEGIEDSRTASVCRIEITPGTEWYVKSPLILKVRRIDRIGPGNRIEVLNIETAEKNGFVFDGRSDRLKALVDGATKGFFQAFPIPLDTVTLNLSVFRLPLEKITDAGEQVLEVDDQHHPHLVMWMRYRSYGKQDAETFDPRARDEAKASFWAYCAMARLEQERARRQVGTVAYGGI